MKHEIKEYIHDLILEEFSVIPVSKGKVPLFEHTFFKERMPIDSIDKMFSKAYGVGVACGEISGGLECIDFDDHKKKYDIAGIFSQFVKNEHVRSLIDQKKVFIQQTPSGGYHFIYRYDAKEYDSSFKMAMWDKDDVMIETRGNGGYFVSSPTPGYKSKLGDLLELITIDEFDRDLIIELCKSFNIYEKEASEEVGENANFHDTDPVSYFNFHKSGYAKNLLKDTGWTHVDTDSNKTERWRRPGKDKGISATWGHKNNALFIFSSSVSDFKTRCYYTPFQILVVIRFKGKFNDALNWVLEKYYNQENPYIRVGVNYFKKIVKTDRYGIDRSELKPWNKEEIKQDHGRKFLDSIPKYNDFTMKPDNFNYSSVINGCYNLYRPFVHEAKQGDIKWSKILLEHIFGDQYELGLRYLQVLYLHPEKMLPILVIVSKQRSTGKTTFINWLNVIFGDNMAMIEPDNLTSSFNGAYANSNVIAIEETLIEKQVAVERLKALSTGKFVTVNQKYVNPYKVPFYGKVILTSNNEDKFARVDQEEIRFFIRKIGYPKFKNYDIETDLIKEIPAFLHHLKTRPPVDFNKARTAFTAEELQNESLEKVKKQSMSSVYKEMQMLFTEFFQNEGESMEFIDVSPIDIKRRWFDRDSKIQSNYIKTVLREEFNKDNTETKKYSPFNCYVPYSFPSEGTDVKSGRPYRFFRSEFIDDDGAVNEESEKVPF